MWPASVVPVRGTMPTSSANQEDDLGDRPAVPPGYLGQLGPGQGVAVGGQQGEALVGQAAGGAEGADVAVPAPRRVAPVLDEARPHPRLVAHEWELPQGEVADAQQAGTAALVQGLHRPPRLPVRRGQAVLPAGAVQQVRVDHVGAQVLQRAGERLLDL